MPDFLLPDLGEGLAQAEVLAWHVQVGDRVTVDQLVVEVETAKAVVELPVPFAGTVTALHATPGTVLDVGQPLISVDTSDEAAGADRPPRADGGFREPGAVLPEPTAADEASGNVLIGYGTSSATAVRRRRAGRTARRHTAPSGTLQPAPQQAQSPAASQGPVLAQSPVSAQSPAPTRPAHASSTTAVPVISPIVRKLAREAGLDLTAIHGTGPSGIVRRRDVEQAAQAAQTQTYAQERSQAQPTTSPETVASPFSSVTSAELHETRIPLRGVRRTVADKLSRSRREIPEATVWVDVDATDLLAARATLNARSPEQPVSLLALLGRFTVLALRRYPELNGRVDADEIVIPGHVNLGFAAQTDRGLVVPVVHDAHRLSVRDLSAALAARTAAARGGRLSPADLTGGTVTVNNYGVFGVDGSAAIINHPEVAIVGMGRIIDRPWVVEGRLAVRKVSQLTLAFDHRVCDGGTAGGFLRMLADYIEQPIAALGDL